jgi:hypothetical protein
MGGVQPPVMCAKHDPASAGSFHCAGRSAPNRSSQNAGA